MLDESKYQLRAELDRILKEYQDQSAQEKAIKIINELHPNSIERARLDDFYEISSENISDYDCFTFALDLIDSEVRMAIRDFAPRKIGPIQRPGIADVLPGPNFVCYLQLQERPSFSMCQDCDLAVYFDSFGKIKHIGKVFKRNIISKWGMKGYLWKHGIWEVPNSYGIEVKFYSQLSKMQIEKQWNAYLFELAKKVKGFTEIVLKKAP
jgi:hypothetical protein